LELSAIHARTQRKRKRVWSNPGGRERLTGSPLSPAMAETLGLGRHVVDSERKGRRAGAGFSTTERVQWAFAMMGAFLQSFEKWANVPIRDRTGPTILLRFCRFWRCGQKPVLRTCAQSADLL